MHFKQAFIDKYSQLTDFGAYTKAVSTFPRKSIRVNTLKSSIAEVKKRLQNQGWQLTEIPWCTEAFYAAHADGRRDIGTLQEHQEGLFFVQKSVSLIPSLALTPQPEDRVLDLCAAPGGKTTHLAMLLHNKGVIVANENDAYRINGLIANLHRCGVMNTVVTQHRADRFPDQQQFDKILLDAPCSGSGLIKGRGKQSLATLAAWNQNYIRGMARVQKTMILHAFDLLREGGTLVYSTCSLEPEENEEVVDHLLVKRAATLHPIHLPVPVQDKKYFRIWPHDADTEGFFVAKLTK